jgi:uncharacterized membrane protein YfcA
VSGVDLLLAGLVLAAAFTQGAIGFGFGLLVMALLPRLMPLAEAVGTVALMGIFVNGFLFWRTRRSFRLADVAPLYLGAAMGLPLGVLLLRNLDPDPATRALGAFLVVYSLWALLVEWRPAPGPRGPAWGRGWAVPAGFLAGILGGAFATGGPPVIVYAHARRWPPDAFKALLQGFFVAATATHLVLLAGASILTPSLAGHAVPFLPLLPLGVWLGARWGERLAPVAFRRLVLAALFALGAEYLVAGR